MMNTTNKPMPMDGMTLIQEACMVRKESKRTEKVGMMTEALMNNDMMRAMSCY
jgi:hypothetical protein